MLNNNIENNLPYTGPDLKRCQFCGHEIKEDFIFCVDCGNKIYGTKKNYFYEVKKFFYYPSKKQLKFIKFIKTIFIMFIITIILISIINKKVYVKYNPGFTLNFVTSSLEKTNFNNAYDLLDDCIFKNSDVIKKYSTNIRVKVSGNYTNKDINSINLIINNLKNTNINIELVDNNENMEIVFDDNTKLNNINGDIEYKFDTNNNIIYSKVVVNHTNTQGFMNSLLMHNFLHLLGLINDTEIKESILSSGLALSLSPTDLLAIKMIYNNNIKSNMSSNEFYEYYKIVDYYEFISEGDKS